MNEQQFDPWNDTVNKLQNVHLIDPNIVKNEVQSVGSVQERALKMEQADPEAVQKEAAFRAEKPSMVQRLLDRLKKRRTEPTLPVSPKLELNQVVADRVVGSQIETQVEQSNDYKFLFDLLGNPISIISQADRERLTRQQLDAAGTKIIEAAQTRLDKLINDLSGEVIYKIDQATNLGQLYKTVNLWPPKFGSTAFDDDYVDKGVRDFIAGRAKPKNMPDTSVSVASDKVYRRIRERHLELVKAEAA